MTTPKKSVLGKGLSALMDSGDYSSSITSHVKSGVADIDLNSIIANPHQPRSRFDEDALAELSDNIKQIGLIQPITVREISNNRFQIISGERRWRASKMAGLDVIPAYIRKTNDEEVLLHSLIENIQREDLDPIEIAVSYQRLIDECQLTQEQLSEKVSKPRTTITNFMRLLKLPPEMQAGIINREISIGHAKVLSGINDSEIQMRLYTDIISNDLTVRQAEALSKQLQEQGSSTIDANHEVKIKNHNGFPSEYEGLKNQLITVFNSNVKLKKNPNGKGEIVIPFSNEEEFERLIGVIEKLQS
jgi:ParB family chromosome partitioning protein